MDDGIYDQICCIEFWTCPWGKGLLCIVRKNTSIAFGLFKVMKSYYLSCSCLSSRSSKGNTLNWKSELYHIWYGLPTFLVKNNIVFESILFGLTQGWTVQMWYGFSFWTYCIAKCKFWILIKCGPYVVHFPLCSHFCAIQYFKMSLSWLVILPL